MIPALLVAVQLSAAPGVDCSLLTQQQAQGLPCAVPPKGTAAPPAPPPPPNTPTQLDPDCLGVNPYADPEKAAECARRPLPGASTPQFLVGHVYRYGYNQQRAVVLGIATDRDGVQVVTFSWLPESNAEGVIAMRTPPAAGGASVWIYAGKP